jgi:DNA-binding NarL/FixJ family response regulator
MSSSAPLEFPQLKRERIRVLVADDSPTMRKIIRSFLQELPHVEICAVATNGTEVADFARMQKPDLLILDVVMPGLSGVEVASVVKKILPHSKVILFTMYEEKVGRTLAKSAGVDIVLAKTGGLAALSDKINAVIEEMT